MSEPISIQQLKDASEDAITLADFIYKPANVMIPRRLAADINSLQYYLDYMSSYAQHSYETYDEMVANASNLSENVSVFVTNDLDTSKNGIYTYSGVSFVKGDYQPENVAKDFVEAKLGGLQVFDGKVRAQDVSTADGLNQSEVNANLSNKLSLILNPKDYGAIGDRTTHPLSERYATLALAQADYPHAVALTDEIDWCAIQAMLSKASDIGDRSVRIDWSGNWFLNRGVTYRVGDNDKGHFRTISGDFHFDLRSDFADDFVIKLHGRGITHSGVIAGDVNYKAKYGIIVTARGEAGFIDNISFGIKLDRVLINSCEITAVKFQKDAMFSSLEFFRGTFHGTNGGYAGRVFDTDVIGKDDFKVGALDSNSNIRVAVMPPHDVAECKTFVSYNGFLSEITVINRAENIITVMPHIPAPTVAEKLTYIWGAAVSTEGSDSANIRVGQLSALGCGFGIDHDAMYPCVVEMLTTEFCGVAMHDGGLVGGLNVLEHYVEGNLYNFVSSGENPGDLGGALLLHGLPLDMKQIAILQFGRDADGSQVGSYGGLRGARIYNLGIEHKLQYNKFIKSYAPASAVIDFNKPHNNTVFQLGGSPDYTVNFAEIKPEYNALFGYDSQEIEFVGSGKNLSPVGTITINPLTGYTLNGTNAPVVFSGFNGSAKFTFFLNVTTKNIEVSCGSLEAGLPSPKSKLDGVPTKSNLNQNVESGYFWVDDIATITGAPTPATAATSRASVKIYQEHAPTYTGYWVAAQEVAFPDIHEVWTRNYNQTTGMFSEWLLVSYQVKKGATAARPVAPKIGMRYYDTTLAAAGKPISYSGTNWVDSLGVVV